MCKPDAPEAKEPEIRPLRFLLSRDQFENRASAGSSGSSSSGRGGGGARGGNSGPGNSLHSGSGLYLKGGLNG